MYEILLLLHSWVRWILLIVLIYSIWRAYKGYHYGTTFGKADNSLRHWTATLSHIQLLIGFTLYLKSPLVSYFRQHFKEALQHGDLVFFGLIHITLMFCAVIILTIGSSISKRRENSREQYKTMLIWFCIALLVILTAIPWPFSPLAHRPYIRAW